LNSMMKKKRNTREMMTSLRLHENCVLDLMFFDYVDIEEKNNVYFGSQVLKGRYII
jgi:hypothetical protein